MVALNICYLSICFFIFSLSAHAADLVGRTYGKTQQCWKVFWKRADLKWHGYEPATVATIDDFLTVVDQDTYCCFWG